MAAVEEGSPAAAAVSPALQPRPVLPPHLHQQVCQCGDSAAVRGIQDQLYVLPGLARTQIPGTRNAFKAVGPRRRIGRGDDECMYITGKE
jgi:hypothetical protein